MEKAYDFVFDKLYFISISIAAIVT